MRTIGSVRISDRWSIIRPGKRVATARWPGGLIHLSVDKIAREVWRWSAAGAGRTRGGTETTARAAQRAAEQAASDMADEGSAA